MNKSLKPGILQVGFVLGSKSTLVMEKIAFYKDAENVKCQCFEVTKNTPS